MSDKLNNLEFEVEDLVTGLSIFASSSKKQPYQKPLVIEIDLSGNSRGKLPYAVESTDFGTTNIYFGPS